MDLAVKKHNEGKLNEAELIYRKILDKVPYNADALHLLGVIAHQVGKCEEAIRYISEAIRLNPNSAIFYSNLGMAQDALGKEDESTESFKKALEINPSYDKAYLSHYNLGVYYMGKGQVKEALEHYNNAIELNENFFEARWNRSLVLLLLGRFEEGWREYEYRFKKKKSSDTRNFGKPKWDGSSFEGKKILIVSEQGFGDTINFIRYVPLVKEKGGYVILECKKELRGLFEGFSGIDELVDKEKDAVPGIEFDFYIHLMSLPGIFNTNLNNIPNKIPYLKAKPRLTKRFKDEINTNNFKIGIVWAGNPTQDNDKNRSTTFEKFKILKKIPGVDLFSLQKGKKSRQLDDTYLINVADKISDFSDTAAIIENLDLIISVDTSVTHLSGAMGKLTWTLLTYMPDWRWLLDRNDSPWYPGMKLFRQPRPGDWNSVFNEVSKELRRLLGKQ